MGKAIHFKSSLFDVSKERENPINPIHGISLLLWLRNQLAGRMEITEPDAEDWGWYSELSFGGNNYLIGASMIPPEDDEPTPELEWVFQIEKQRSFSEELLGKNKMTDTDPCFLFFKALFEENPNFVGLEIS